MMKQWILVACVMSALVACGGDEETTDNGVVDAGTDGSGAEADGSTAAPDTDGEADGSGDDTAEVEPDTETEGSAPAPLDETATAEEASTGYCALLAFCGPEEFEANFADVAECAESDLAEYGEGECGEANRALNICITGLACDELEEAADCAALTEAWNAACGEGEGSGTEGSGTEGSGTEGSGTEGSGAEGSGTEGSGAEGSGT